MGHDSESTTESSIKPRPTLTDLTHFSLKFTLDPLTALLSVPIYYGSSSGGWKKFTEAQLFLPKWKLSRFPVKVETVKAGKILRVAFHLTKASLGDLGAQVQSHIVKQFLPKSYSEPQLCCVEVSQSREWAPGFLKVVHLDKDIFCFCKVSF